MISRLCPEVGSLCKTPVAHRRVAEAATTRAVKARLLDDAGHYDELAAKADRAGTEAEEP
jgi:hypothetical protein